MWLTLKVRLGFDFFKNIHPFEKEMTPLHVAAKYRQMDVYQLIYESVADKFPRNSNGKTPSDLLEGEVEPSREHSQITLA